MAFCFSSLCLLSLLEFIDTCHLTIGTYSCIFFPQIFFFSSSGTLTTQLWELFLVFRVAQSFCHCLLLFYIFSSPLLILISIDLSLGSLSICHLHFATDLNDLFDIATTFYSSEMSIFLFHSFPC